MSNKILVTRSSMPELEEYVEEIRDIWDSHWLTNMGEKHKNLQQQLKDYMKVENVELLTNGHMALELTMQAMNLQGEVITSPFTFASTTHAIVRNGLIPVFCDVNPIDFTIDVTKLESLITDKTCAIVPVHVYGNICNVEEIDRIAHKYGLKVIYDAAHTFGEEYKGCGIGTFGDASCFSFHATKVFNTIEGGAVCYKDELLGQRLYNLKNFGIRGPEDVESVGANAKMNEFQAAMGLCNLRHVESEEILEKCPKVVIIDHHRRSADFIENATLMFQEVYASSASELVTELLQYATQKVDLKTIEAESLYAGIMMDTKNFTFKTGVRTFEAAAYLRRCGVDIIRVKKWFQSDLESFNKIADIVKRAEIVNDTIAISINK